MDRPQCCIDRCLTKTKSIKVKDIIYYLFPTDAEWAHKWEKKIKDFDPKYRRKSNDIVCSLHFAKTSMQPVTRQLVDHAQPIYFPQKLSESQAEKKTQQLTFKKSVNSVVRKPLSISSKCCIIGCPTDFNNAENKIQGFKFPDDLEQRKKWLFIIELYNNQKFEWQNSMKVCALHFSSTCFSKDDKLDEGAKPSVFKHATMRRQIEIAKQQSQKIQSKNLQKVQPNNVQKTQQPNNPRPKRQQSSSVVIAQSINVPLHKSNVNNQSASLRSAPIIGRRLSLPYAKLPPLIPKPNILKRANPMQTSSQHIEAKIKRLSRPSGAAPMTAIAKLLQATATKTNQRPLPALNKVTNISGSVDAAQLILRNSLPAQLTPNTANVYSAKSIPNKPGQITRLPPALKPRPQQQQQQSQLNAAPKTCLKIQKAAQIDRQIAVISRIQSNKPATEVNESSDPAIKQNNTNAKATSLDKKEQNPDIIVIEDEDVDIAMALNQSKPSEVEAANDSATNSNGLPSYTVQDEARFRYPKFLLERILLNKRTNEELKIKEAEIKKRALKMNKQHRLSLATTSSETIEIP